MSKEQDWASKQVINFNQTSDSSEQLILVGSHVDKNGYVQPPYFTKIMDNRKQNSRDARERSLPKAETDKGKILDALRNLDHAKYMLVINPNADGMSAIEISFMSEVNYHAVNRRMSELVRAELVEVCGKRNGYSLYRIKEEAK